MDIRKFSCGEFITVKGEASTSHERRSLYHPLKKKSLTIGDEDMIFVPTMAQDRRKMRKNSLTPFLGEDQHEKLS